MHPKIRPDGTSQKIRNGVGACKGGAIAVPANADDPVTFDTFESGCFATGLAARTLSFSMAQSRRLYALNSAATTNRSRLGQIVGVVQPDAAGKQ